MFSFLLPFKYLLTKRAKINVLTLIIVVPGNMDCLSIFGWSICWQDSYHHLENTHSADDGSDVPKFIKKISSRTRFKTRESIPQALCFLLGKGRSEVDRGS